MPGAPRGSGEAQAAFWGRGGGCEGTLCPSQSQKALESGRGVRVQPGAGWGRGGPDAGNEGQLGCPAETDGGRNVGHEEGDRVSGLLGHPVVWLPEVVWLDEKVWLSSS